MNLYTQPLISVVTIVYNGIDEIEKTIQSIIAQDYKNFELIIIDGGSNDGTQKIIEKYINSISYYVSEKDNGVYDAMNKGIRASNGKWINFMNGGDQFYNSSVLSNIFKLNNQFDSFSLLYGYKYTDGIKVLPKNLKVLENGIIMGNHQTMFFNKKNLGDKLIYSLRFPIYGDFELVNRIYLTMGSNAFKNIEKPIAIYAGGGISSMVSFQKRKDKYLILWESYGIFHVIKGLFVSLMLKLKRIAHKS
jgi:glycosyltransferase involved in cell wall biosynthesis